MDLLPLVAAGLQLADVSFDLDRLHRDSLHGAARA
jgi:hypothetical protein